MPFNFNENREAKSAARKVQNSIELANLRAELDDIRTKFGTLLAKLDLDGGVTDTNYGTTQALAARRWTA